jgi:polar amino acid transport system ATP-binding protein/sulfate transport system ATP-binding protein
MCSKNLLLMDEPFSGLDVNAIDKVCEFIQEVASADEMQTLVIVTHDIAAAVEVCDTIWLLGRDRDEKGNVIPGARVVKTYDLIERGLAWRKNIIDDPKFLETVREIRLMFAQL